MNKPGLLFFITWLFMSTALADPTETDPPSKEHIQVYPIYNDIELKSTLKFEYDRPRIVIKLLYPQLQSDHLYDGVENFNQMVLDVTQDQITQFKTKVSSLQETIKALAKTVTKKTIKNDLYLDYNTSYLQIGKNPILSIRFSIQGYIDGMAHPYHQHQVLNFDLNNNKKIELSELFRPDVDYLHVLSLYTSEVLNKRLDNQSLVATGTAPTAENFKNWNLKPNGILITFDEAQVAPYIYGSQTVLVPFSILKDFIGHDSPIAGCVLGKKRCYRNNLLTGGFIDTAINTHHRVLNPGLRKL